MESLGSIPQPFPFGRQQQEDSCDDSLKERNSTFEADDISMKNDMDDVSSTESDNDEGGYETAIRLKNEATDKIKSSDFTSARDINKRAVSKLLKYSQKKMSSENESESVRNALRAAYLNQALCHLKLEEWSDAIGATSSVLKQNKFDVKALYRRSQAYQKIGSLQEAYKDLALSCKLTKNNTEMVEELNKVREMLKESNFKEKQRYSGLFAKTNGLYNDKAERTEESKTEDEKKEEQPDAASQSRETQKKESSPAPLEDSKNQVFQDSKQTTSSFNPAKDSLSMELDEEEQKIVDETKKMGYCYFNRNKSANSSVCHSDHLPKKLETSTTMTNETSNKQGKSLSSWNAGGTTYEERDCTSWGSDTFKKLLMSTEATSEAFKFIVTDVTFLSKECQIVVLRSSKRYLYDFSCEVSWEMQTHVHNDDRIKGSMTLLDISSTVSSSSINNSKEGAQNNFPEWLRSAKTKVNEKPKNENILQILEKGIIDFQKSLLEKVQQFELDYKAYA